MKYTLKHLLAAGALIIAATSCNMNYEKTKSGLAYKIYKGDGKQQLKFGDIVKINASIKITPKDTILFTTANRLPEYIPVDTSSRLTHDYNEVLKQCSVGDSLIVVSQVDTLVARNMAQYNDMFKRGDQIVTTIKILKVVSKEDQPKDQQMEMEKETAREVADLQAYIAKKGIKAQKTKNGVFVEIVNAGSPDKVVEGKRAVVNYKGSLIESGKVFDSNMDSSFGHMKPYPFIVGASQSIRGLEEGIMLIGKGGKANLYIPAMLAYGPQGSPPAITPYAALKFEIELLDVITAPPAPQGPPMQGMGAAPQGSPNY